eukprot:CAMPEP_0182490334 /NCGR_PEP_ID=MMETSP1321-20130603/234_1 /TAXON_ID=91990 /ORGANISM="Bolidomonas sp., Strain RCC1657" /LENGTH=46 /DNA_ID= /DNA_START= /DNA_END= /DNA_ORIENTATION=
MTHQARRPHDGEYVLPGFVGRLLVGHGVWEHGDLDGEGAGLPEGTG